MEVEGLNFHPDTPFSDYIAYADDKPTYTPEQCAERERLLDQCFDLAGDGIYEIGRERQFELLGLPSPTRADYNPEADCAQF